MITLGSPAYLLLGAAVLLMAFGVLRLARWRRDARRSFAGPHSRSWPSLAFWPRSLFLLAAAGLIVFAAARPQWGSNQLVRDSEGIDLVLVLDISQSMTAADVEPSRMSVAQANLMTLVESQRGSRFGLVFFAGSAFLRSPLTADSQAMSGLIMRADREIGLTRVGSDLGAALEQAGAILEASENTGRAIVVVSDGEDHAGTYEEQAAALAAQDIAVFTAGVGTTEGAALFDVDAEGNRTPKLDASGAQVVSRLQPESLQAIAGIAGGSYTQLEGGSTGLLGLRNELARLDQAPLGAESQEIPIERFQIFVAAALVLLLLSWFTPSRLPLPSLRRLRARPAYALVLLALLTGACGEDPLRERNQAANELYESGDYEGALTAYEELLAERPDIEAFSYNAGNTLHRLESYERAINETQRALPPSDPGLGADTYYSLGNHLLALERLEEAYVAYRNSLLLDPDDGDAKHNLELTLRLMQQADAPPQPGEQPPQPGQGEGPGPGQDGSPPGEATPGEDGEPGAGETPEPGEDGGAAEGTPGAGGTPSAGSAQSQAALQRALEEALAGIDEELSFEEAVRILDLLRQQREQQPSQQGDASGPDY